MKRILDISLIVILVLGLFLIRAYEGRLFYDPLIVYFQNDYLYTAPPDIRMGRFFLDVFFRYMLNSLLSLAILWVMFRKRSYLRFSLRFFGIAFLILSVVLAFFILTDFDSGYLFPFYVRRFLVQPLFLFLLIPAFYYHKRLR